MKNQPPHAREVRVIHIPFRSRSPGRTAILASVLLSVLPSGLEAQDGVRLSPGCPECRIHLDTMVVLGETDGPGMIESEGNIVEVDPEGRFYVMGQQSTSVKVFSPQGRFLGAIGRDGEGPGEFRWTYTLDLDAEGRIWIGDVILSRIAVFDPEHRLERTIPVRGFMLAGDVFPFRGDSVLVGGYSMTPELLGRAVHLLSPDGHRARSFGEPPHPVEGPDPHGYMRSVAPARNGGIWVASRDRYLIEHWSEEGDRMAILRRDVDWFEPLPASAGDPPPPRAFLRSISQDPDGLLWVTLGVPGGRWREAAERDPGSPHGWRMVDEDLWMTTVVEVIDPERGQVLASVRLPRRATSVFGDWLIGETRIDVDAGRVEIAVMRMELRDGGRGRAGEAEARSGLR